MTNDRTIDLRAMAIGDELTQDQLENASGGRTVTAPRDSVSGNATGRRAYKPVEF